MAVVENNIYEEYLNNLTKRLVMPTMVMIWSMEHPLFPQVSWFYIFQFSDSKRSNVIILFLSK